MDLRMVVLLFISVSCTNPEPASLRFDTHATLAIKSSSGNSEHTVYGRYHAFLLPEWNYTDTLRINKSDDYYLKFHLRKPGQISLFIDDTLSVTLFLIPDDTVHLKLDLSSHGNILSTIGFEGQHAIINDYMLRLSEEALSETSLSNKSFLTMSFLGLAAVLDSINHARRTFLKKYNETYNLPQWFVEHVMTEIKYGLAHLKLEKKRLGIKKEIPDGYFEFLNELPINNPNAIYSESYYNFLTSYFYYKVAPDDLILHVQSNMKMNSHNVLSLADSLLDGEIREIYKCHNISAQIKLESMRYTTRGGKMNLPTEDEFLAEELMKSYVNNFKHKSYSQYLENYYNTKFVLDYRRLR